MAEIGKLNKLKIVKKVDFGVYLDGGDLGEILLPKRYVPEKCENGDIVEVFINFDSEDRIIATTEKPYATVGQFAFLRVVSVSSVGAFLGWGLQKDLFVPFREQKEKMKEDESYIIFIYVDEIKTRIVASSRIDRFLKDIPTSFREGQKVNLLIYSQTDIGYKAIIDNSHWGIIYKNEVFEKLEKGQEVKGFIKKVREDNKIDLTLHEPGYKKIVDLTGKIIDKLKERGGFIPVTDKTLPEIIYDLFGVSKSTFKKAIGALYKKRLIAIEDKGIRLR
ncbi:MAG: S1-like domain-containing RNA-binding protein [bacterium]|nr:S1-like domain-containing RNA-binding protein [bacterium]